MKPTLLFLAATAVMAAPSIAQELPSAGPISGECFARVVVPAQYGSVEQIMIPRQDGTFELRTIKLPKPDPPMRTEWRQILCEADAGPTVVRAIQQALQQEGFYDAPPDGYLGNATHEAVKKFQISRHLSTGGLTLYTLKALGVDWRAINGYPQQNLGVVSGGFSTGKALPVQTFTTAGGYVIEADGTVRNSAGALIGKLNGSGEIIANGVVIGMINENYEIIANGVVIGRVR